MRSVGFLMAALLLVCASAATASEQTLRLPTPEAARVQQAKLITAVGGRPDRLLASDVPGPVVNDEVVHVGLAGDGSVVSVLADQRLRLTGEGDYAIRERGPARSAASLSSEPPPVTRRGAVVWQGFSPGRRDLAARLTLDPQLETTRLPLTVSATFAPTSGAARAMGPGGAVPAPGTVRLTITNATAQPADLPTAADVAPSVVAPLLDRARATARRPSAQRLPSTAAGLPAEVHATGVSTVASVQAVPYRLTGSLHLDGADASFTGPAIRSDGTFAGTLGGSREGTHESVTFVVSVQGPGRLVLDLTAVAALNPHELLPPDGLASWASWAAGGPSRVARRAALDLLVAVAATGARASSYGPYLGADLEGTGSTTFRYATAPAAAARSAAVVLHPRWGAISLVAVLLMLVIAGAAAIWRRS